ncbi:MAG: hypothetical protein OEV49_06370 [candidate division Zixibacteria bacterium]|nr:hypothetical protein [candidate division Zixibacteria bacterium]
MLIISAEGLEIKRILLFCVGGIPVKKPLPIQGVAEENCLKPAEPTNYRSNM